MVVLAGDVSPLAAVTKPVAGFIVATAVLPLLQLPPVRPSVFNCTPVPEQTMDGPVMVPALATETTVTLKLSDFVLPAKSVAVYLTFVVPKVKVDPLDKPAVRAMVAPGQLSDTVGAGHVTTWLQVVILAGRPLITGAWVSFIVTVKLAETALPAASVAV